MNIHALKGTFTCGIYNINTNITIYINAYQKNKQTNKTSSTIFGYLINGDEENEFQLHGCLLRPSTTCPKIHSTSEEPKASQDMDGQRHQE